MGSLVARLKPSSGLVRPGPAWSGTTRPGPTLQHGTSGRCAVGSGHRLPAAARTVRGRGRAGPGRKSQVVQDGQHPAVANGPLPPAHPLARPSADNARSPARCRPPARPLPMPARPPAAARSTARPSATDARSSAVPLSLPRRRSCLIVPSGLSATYHC